jgi:hypothetical protein
MDATAPSGAINNIDTVNNADAMYFAATIIISHSQGVITGGEAKEARKAHCASEYTMFRVLPVAITVPMDLSASTALRTCDLVRARAVCSSCELFGPPSRASTMRATLSDFETLVTVFGIFVPFNTTT